jgi:hypothetical protein
MPKAYSWDMRKRVIAEVENGASRREAAEEFEVSASTAIMWSLGHAVLITTPKADGVSGLAKSQFGASRARSLGPNASPEISNPVPPRPPLFAQ